jgi:hypothetical protein
METLEETLRSYRRHDLARLRECGIDGVLVTAWEIRNGR